MQWSPDTLSTFLQCALLYNGATMYTTVQYNELQILSDENFLFYKCCTVLLSSALQTMLQCSAVLHTEKCTHLHWTALFRLSIPVLSTLCEAPPSCPEQMESGIWSKSRPKSKIVSESEATSDCGFLRVRTRLPQRWEIQLPWAMREIQLFSREKYSC